MHPLDRKLLRDLYRLRGQLLAIALVVACGIASFVMSLSALNSLELTQATYYDRYRFAEVFAELKRAPETLAAQIRDIPGVAQVQTRVVADVTLDVPELAEPATGRLVAIPEQGQPVLNDLFLRQGRYIEPGHSDEVLASEAFATANGLKVGDSLGAIIKGRWERLQIVGIALSPEYVYEVRGGGSIFPDNRRFGVLWMGQKALGTAFDMDAAFNSVALTLSPGAIEAEVIDRLDRLLTPYGGLGAYGREDQVSHHILANELRELRSHATVFPSIFLAIAAFLLHIVLARLIGMEREQIAVLKAFGYSNVAVGAHYLKLVLAVVGVGTLLGIALGTWMGSGLTAMYTWFFRFPLLRYDASPALMVAAMSISGGAAVGGGMTAVRRAVSLPPAEAMRPAPPAQFRPTLVEQWGLQRWFSPASRIVLRNLERQPIQAVLTTLGIAIAVAILIAGRFFLDSLDYLVDVQFRTMQREDVTLAFIEPLSARARFDVMHLPGVLRAEPFRLVPARLRYEHRMRRIALTGLEPDSELRQLVDRSLHRVSLPTNGVVLTAELAKRMELRSGDWLTVEALEGSRPVRSVPVAGTVDELLGLSAYMDMEALNRLMGEGRAVSGAYLAVDANQLERLFSRLKEIPAIANVTTRAAALQSFEEISGTNVRVFTSVLVVFACVISVSVIYNAARIALSERERELASLRIMGFTRGEIAYILLGEQAVLTVVAIPVGFLLGLGLAHLMVAAIDTELMRLPAIVTRSTFAFATVVILLAATGSGWIVRRRLDRMDLIAVLKTRE
jgi:putative ABC transport system permease protein